jgi:cytochrome c5
MSRKHTFVALALWLAFLAAGVSATGQDSKKPNSVNTPKVQSAKVSESKDGQRVFAQNCSRCHKAPETIPSSISGTVALHMRIRASLSERDYKRLLAFLNP